MATEVGDVDTLARKFVANNWMSGDAIEEAVVKSREAVKEWGCRNMTHFLRSLAATSPSPLHEAHGSRPDINLHTLILYDQDSRNIPYIPLFGVHRWGRDGLLLRWEELLEEIKEEEEGSLELGCMHAIGSLCRTSLRELQLIGLRISPMHLNNLFQAMHQLQLLPISNSPAHQLTTSSARLNTHNNTAPADPGCALQCLRLWGLIRCNAGTSSHGEVETLLALPPSLRFLQFDDDSDLYQPPIQLLAPPNIVAELQVNAPAAAAAAGEGVQKGGEIAKSSSRYTLSSLLRCPHLNQLQGLSIFERIKTGRSSTTHAQFIRSDEELRNAAVALTSNKSLKAFHLNILMGDDKPALLPEEFATQVLKLNTTLTTLHLWNFKMAEPLGFDHFFEEGVANNHTLTQLSLYHCEGPWTLASILDALQDNGSLHDIELRRTPLASDEAIEAQVQRNKKSAEILKRMGVNPGKVPPTVARVFLCGEPYAGKTTIVKSLRRSTQRNLWDKDWLLYHRLGKERPRTKGIEVTTLERDGVKISLWDLAGQDEYRCFHDYVFPDLSNRQSPSFFLFVWSPVHPKTQEQKTGDMFCKEFDYWLRFITSKTRRTKKFIPNLIIAITRKDKVRDVKASLEHEITLRQKKFESFITFGMSSVFEVDARDSLSLDQLVQQMFETSKGILKVVKPVLELHEKIHMLFERKLANGEISPIITIEEYKDICEKALGEGSHEIAESIALSLNESGDFIYSGSHKFIIVDTRWFCHAIMGNLIHSTGPSSVVTAQKGPGFFEKNHLESFLAEQNIKSNGGVKGFFPFCRKRKTKVKTPQVSGDILLKLLMELDVVCKDPTTSKIFLPSNLISQEDSLPSNAKILSSQGTTAFQLGRRLQCADSEHTFLTPGVFPGLQVTFFNKFSPRVKLQKDYIDVNHHSGVHIIIELCAIEGEDHSIDILVDSPQRSLTYNVEWIKRHVVEDIIKLCASKKGIQGVRLVQSVIGPCKSIYLRTKRRNSVLIEDLKIQLEQDFMNNCDATEVFYAWPCDETTPVERDKITNLLSAVEVQEVLECYRKKLKEIVSVMTTDLNPFLNKTTNEENGLIYKSKNIEGDLEKILKAIFHEINDMKEKVHNDMIQIHTQLQIINKKLFDLQHEVSERFLTMQELIKQSGERKLPTMWLLSIDTGKVNIAKIVHGFHRARLQLLCEHRSQPHLPQEQKGLAFSYLDDETFLQKALPYMQIFLKFAYVATKLSAHLICGGGNLIPDFSQVTSLIEDGDFSMPSLPELERSSNLPQDDASSSIQQFRTKYQERARVWLWGFLEKNQCDKDFKINELFNLRPVRYEDDNEIGWLCETHYSEGKDLGKLKLICSN